MSINRGMDKEDTVHIYNGMLYSHWKERNDLMCNNMMVLEIVTLNNLSKTEKYHMLSLIGRIKKWYKWHWAILKQPKCIFSNLQEPEIWNWGTGRVGSSGGSKESLFPAPLIAPGGGQQALMSFVLQMHHSNLCPCRHTTFSPLCVCVCFLFL